MEKSAYQIYGEPVRAYWHEAETIMTADMAKVLQTAAELGNAKQAAETITDYCNRMQTQAFEDAGKLLNDVRLYMNRNSNTMKNGRNPETHEILDELKPVDPLTVTMDAAVYSYTPEIPAVEESPTLFNLAAKAHKIVVPLLRR